MLNRRASMRALQLLRVMQRTGCASMCMARSLCVDARDAAAAKMQRRYCTPMRVVRLLCIAVRTAAKLRRRRV